MGRMRHSKKHSRTKKRLNEHIRPLTREEIEREIYVKSLSHEELIEEIERIEEETAFYQSEITKYEAELAQYHAEIMQTRQDLGYSLPDPSVKLRKRDGKLSGTLKEFSQSFGMPEVVLEETFNSLTEKGALNKTVKARFNKQKRVNEEIYTISHTRLLEERPDLVSYVSLEDYERDLKEGIEYKLGLCEKCSRKSGISFSEQGGKQNIVEATGFTQESSRYPDCKHSW